MRYLDTAHLEPRCGRSFGIGVSHRVQQVMARWVWMALNDYDAPGHDAIILKSVF